MHQQAAISQAETIVEAGAKGGLADLEAAAAAAKADHETQDKAKSDATITLTNARSALRGMHEQLDRFSREQSKAREGELAARQDPLCDLNAAEELRQALDAKTEDDTDAAIAECNKQHEDSIRYGNSANTRAWGHMTTYLANYQLENHEIRDQNWQQAQAMILAEIKRMTELELVEKKDEADRAYAAAVDVFRSDVAHTLLNGFDAIEEQIKGLNRILDKAPEFTNGERYQFKVGCHRRHGLLDSVG